MKKTILLTVIGLLIVPVISLSSIILGPSISTVSAAQCEDGTTVEDGLECTKPEKGPTCMFGGPKCVFNVITNTALFIIGALSVLMLIYGGIRYTLSMGDEKNVTAAKNTILYAIVGIVVAIMAYAIVNFVVVQLIK